MLAASIPARFPIAWGASAGGGLIRPIPQASQIGINPGFASLTDGFVPLNAQPVAAGGIPPFVQDTNGILNEITLWNQWQAAGGPIGYDATFSAAIGGYPKGAVLASATFGGYWLCTVDNNTTNPDAAGAGWRAFGNGRIIDTQVFATAGTFTYTPAAGVFMLRLRGCAAGGAGGGTAITGVGQAAVGGGGGAGSSGEVLLFGNGSGVAITIGAAGTAVSGASGNPGGATAFGTNFVLAGGAGGPLGIAATPPFITGGSSGGGLPATSGVTAINLSGGQNGAWALAVSTSNAASGGGGSCPPFGAGGSPVVLAPGAVAIGWGGGGSGACAVASTGAQAGGNGTPGKMIVEGFS